MVKVSQYTVHIELNDESAAFDFTRILHVALRRLTVCSCIGYVSVACYVHIYKTDAKHFAIREMRHFCWNIKLSVRADPQLLA